MKIDQDFYARKIIDFETAWGYEPDFTIKRFDREEGGDVWFASFQMSNDDPIEFHIDMLVSAHTEAEARARFDQWRTNVIRALQGIQL